MDSDCNFVIIQCKLIFKNYRNKKLQLQRDDTIHYWIAKTEEIYKRSGGWYWRDMEKNTAIAALHEVQQTKGEERQKAYNYKDYRWLTIEWDIRICIQRKRQKSINNWEIKLTNILESKWKLYTLDSEEMNLKIWSGI